LKQNKNNFFTIFPINSHFLIIILNTLKLKWIKWQPYKSNEYVTQILQSRL
jgi:hypothetical protein